MQNNTFCMHIPAFQPRKFHGLSTATQYDPDLWLMTLRFFIVCWDRWHRYPKHLIRIWLFASALGHFIYALIFFLFIIFIFIPRHTIVAGYYVSHWSSVSPSTSVRPSVCFSFPDDNLSKRQWIFTKLGICIDIVEIWFGIANGHIS